ncbi:peptidylprolyl isomerase [Paraburkholderia sp. SIMBA_055]|jgi:peptidyl-prolyl cis-trans isomerase C|uniref:peptidylprolyl isomerase n=2 Tax=Paraburkholderia graminis TaxID=60548 RepID=B1FZ65_PARG4|nr:MULTISPECIES: peptidylprolyl isomerase [Paraburkholderia]ALE54660.1 peptidylprolyl isomerase [Burkholderia sp. HB1]AXF07978.1 peptidylprolyl isomerase [Paraburkholderia graminis]EDT11019.1 PpiC-type peptidyl-prolyl cis-trans isomerase [Paraburkholderia graminis C4D1M]MDQ0623144.1 peptidyl-prolyl cis-trans isomerase C [Paraburkholderia graminis]MDR6206654.1 peptidyl-prolyl cis-trans isomerase C [Paraburkholderia graminis]
MTLKKTRLWVLLAAFAAAPAFAQNIAVVNGTPIPKARADALIDQLVHQGQQNTPQLQMAVREELVNREILMQEALRRGLPNRPDIKAQIAVAQQTVVLRALIEDFVKKNTPSDAEVTARYNALIKDAGGKEYHLHHILVDNEQQAKDLIAKIKGGASFEDLAKQYSKDPGSGKNGGDLDWSDPKAYVPEFADAATHLQKGQMSETPVHTQFGWHIIRVDDVRSITPPPLEQVRPQIVQQIQQEKLQAFEEGLRKNAKIQ